MQTYSNLSIKENLGSRLIQDIRRIVYFAEEIQINPFLHMARITRYAAPISLLILLISCGDKKEEKKPGTDNGPVVVLKKDNNNRKDASATREAAPVINITDTAAGKYQVLCIRDSAINSTRLSQKLAQIYGVRLTEIIRKNKLRVTGPPHAWYKSQKAPFFFEAGLPVDKKPAKMGKNMIMKKIGGDSAVVAHFYGPYEQTGMAYEALQEWLKDRKKKLRSAPYEIYVGDPIDKDGKPVDPYKVLTDIVFPRN